MNRKILTLTLLMVIVPGAAMGASVYKWTDENGVIHFGDRQPTGAKAERVNVRSGTSADASGNQQSPQERLQNQQEQQATEAEQRQATAAEEALRKQRDANCATARSNLDVIKLNARIRVEENGEQRYLSEEEIAEKRAEFERIAEENCEPAEQ
ncbi:DUF4124 domain-containing protein [Marinobacter sp. F3R08]|uniref:DUF4124 domain-containing protein n=1 Tax=Marinobacter sp. F3R08 TaxID=2841559 RepID=UPI001C09AECB|nr:DUF4124 domain-containing protein [Marinobacter sp. F3R08]MBU2952340.1 DUF4124 domain-containing protein [Marinobacter sp. F3R08]